MKPVSIVKTLLAFGLSLAVVFLAATDGQSATAGGPTVSVTAVSGYAGHAFVYAQVSDGSLTFPAPTGTTHQSPYYAQWVPLPLSGLNCPWLWGVYVYDRASDTQINPPANPLVRNFGTSTIVCPTPGKTPVDQPPMADASAQLDLDLVVRVSPTLATAGISSTIAATLTSRLSQDLNLYLNMAIEDWHVTSWFVDFGDGSSARVPGGSRSIAVPHVYLSAGQYDARVVASIAGRAQAAIYDRFGWPHLLEQGFTVDVGNDALANLHAQALRRYLPPVASVTVVPSLSPLLPDPRATGLRQVDVVRGRLTLLAVHMLVLRDGELTVDGRFQGFGQSRLTAWRLDGSPASAPPGIGTPVGVIHAATDLLALQWNAPDRIVGSQAVADVIPMTLYVSTRYPDGHLVNYAIASSFSVMVDFAALSG